MPAIDLPKSLTLDTLRTVARLWPHEADEIAVRLHPAQWVHPAGIVGLACLVRATQLRGARITVDAAKCHRAGYWERMGFFRVLELPGPAAAGVARQPRGRFSELRLVADMDDVDDITEALVSVTTATREARRVYRHVVGEALNNVCQHSDAQGFCLAQYYPQSDDVRFCIGDFGCGLRHSLRLLEPEDDRAAILQALEVGVTGRPPQFMQPQMRNRGVGLSAIKALVEGNRGSLTVWSGDGIVTTERPNGFSGIPRWSGTIVDAHLRRADVREPFDVIMAAIAARLREVEQDRPRRAR